MDFSKSSVLGATGSEGLRIRSCFAWIFVYEPGLAVVVWRPFSRSANGYPARSLVHTLTHPQNRYYGRMQRLRR